MGEYSILTPLKLPIGASLQGSRRFGRRHFGVPPGGAADQESLRLANVLVGNDQFAPAWEIPLLNAVFEAEADATVAVVGAAGKVVVNGVEKPSQACYQLLRGQTLEIGLAELGVFTYVAVGQGQERRFASPPLSLKAKELRFTPGPDEECEIAGMNYQVSPESNRMGVKLLGEPLPTLPERPSRPVAIGTIQLANNGLPIILGCDGPTIGGYPRIGTVISADLDKVAQLRPGSRVRLQSVSIEEATKLSTDESLRMFMSLMMLIARA